MKRVSLGIFRDVCRQTTFKANDTVNDMFKKEGTAR